MSRNLDSTDKITEFPNKIVYQLALLFVFLGALNSTPLIPGWTELWRGLTGLENLKTRSRPVVLSNCIFIMMLVVALKHSMWREWRGSSFVWLGAFKDISLVISAAAISSTYLIEIDSVCLIDIFTGERAQSWPRP